MILIDANILLYAYDATDPRHERVAMWLEQTMGGSESIGLDVATVLAFIRIAGDPRVYAEPMSSSQAIERVASWLGRPNVQLLEPTGTHWATLAGLAESGKARGPLVMDAHLAAMAIERGATLATGDRDFARFGGLRTVDPTSP